MKWERFARRTHAPLSARLLQEAQLPARLSEATGIAAGLHNHVWLKDTIYIPETEVNAQQTFIESKIISGDWSFLQAFARRCRDAMERLGTTADSVASDVAGVVGADELAECFATWVCEYRNAMSFVPIFRTIDHALVAQISEQEAAAFLSGDARHVTEETRERAELNWLAAQLHERGDMQASSPEANAMIERHAHEFAWLRMRWYLGEPFTIDEIRRRVRGLLASRRSFAEPAIAARTSEPADRRQALIGELAFLRSSRAEAINKAIWNVRPLIMAIGDQLDLDYEEVIHLLHVEIDAALREGTSPARDLIARRREAFATVLREDAFSAYAGEQDVATFAETLDLAYNCSAESPTEAHGDVLLRGVVASPGHVLGAVRLVHTDADDAKVGIGDILVTTMTFPSLVGAMQRSGAIVTDDGGLLSHAAVTARELGKPCLIGTGRATEVLSDGDMVEVDAQSGVVRRAAADDKPPIIQQRSP